MMKLSKISRSLLSLMLSVLILLTSFPIGSVLAAENEKMGVVSALTENTSAEIQNNNQENVTVNYDNTVKIDWSAKNTEIGRNSDGWWVGIKITAPKGYTIDQLNSSTYKTLYYGYSDWSSGKSFWNAQDSDKSNTDPTLERYITMWAFINESVLNDAIRYGKTITNEYEFDWDSNGDYEQSIVFNINPNKVELFKKVDGNRQQVYPNNSLGTVTAITAADNMEVNGSNTNITTVENKQNITLSWSQANSVIGRNSDGWWAGIKISAPEGYSIEQLNSSTYKTLYYGYSSWSSGKSFWNAQDSNKNNTDPTLERYITMWAFVNDSVLNNAKNNSQNIENKYQFDWDNDGVYEQSIVFSLDPNNIELDPANLYAMDKAEPVISVPEDSTSYSKEDVTVNFTVADEGTESNATIYTSGIKGVYYSDVQLEEPTVDNIKALNAAVASTDEENTYSFTVSNSFDARYYIYAIDNADNISINSIGVKVDKDGPEFGDTEAVDLSEWTNNDIVIKGDISDKLSGIKDENNFNIITEAKNVSLTYNAENGEYVLTVPAQTFNGSIELECTDNVGNKFSKTFSVLMDKTNCYLVEKTATTPDGWSNSAVTIKGQAADADSGLKNVSAKCEGTDLQPEVEISEDGKFNITVPAQDFAGDCIITLEDNAGNSTGDEIKVPVKIDNSSPAVESISAVSKDNETINASENWLNGNVIVSGTVEDNLSGVNTVYYVKGDGAEDLTLENISEKLTKVDSFENGKYTFEIGKQDYNGNYAVYCVDNAGNISQVKTVTVKMDKTAPTDLKVVFPNANNKQLKTFVNSILEAITFGFYQPSIEIKLTATDPTSNGASSNISKFDYTILNTKTKNEITGKEDADENGNAYISVADEGNYIVSFVACDNAGNFTSYNSINNDDIQGAVIDKTPPKIDESGISYTNEIKSKDGKHYFSSNAVIEFAVDEEYFFEKYSSNASAETEDISALENDVTLEITKDGESYYEGNAAANEENSKLFNAVFDEDANTITVTIPSVVDGEANDGDFVVTVGYTDLADHSAEISTETIVIDTIAPVVEITYDNNASSKDAKDSTFFNAARTATIKVTEHNFAPEYIVSEITAKDVNGNDLENVTAINELKGIINAENWKDEGNNIHTFTILYSDDAWYTFSLSSAKDYALNEMNPNNENKVIYAENTVSSEEFVVDKTAPSDVEITYEEKYNVLETIAKGIFWFFNPQENEYGLSKCTVTLTSTDATSGVQYFKYSYDVNDDVNTANVGGADDKAIAVVDADDKGTATYTFEIPAQFRGTVTASAVDNSGNATEKETIDTKNIVVDDIAPGLTVEYSEATNPADNNTKGINYYDGDVTVTLTVNEENFMDGEFAKENVRDMVIKADITDDENNTNPEFYEVNNWKRTKDDDGNDTDTWTGSFVLQTEGDYVLNISYTDKSGNKVTYNNSAYLITIDKTAPIVEVTYDSTPKPIHTVDGRAYYNANRSATVTVTEHNFYAGYFDTEGILKAQNIVGKDVTNYIKYFKDDNNWTHDGNVHTIRVDFTSDANYIFDFDFVDLAKNAIEDYQADLFTVDKTAPKNLKVSYSTSVLDTVINAITFGFYDKRMQVTISADDETSGIYHFAYSYLIADGVSGVNSELVNDAIKHARITLNGKTSTAVFSIPKSELTNKNQFNGTVEFTAYDFAENNTFKEDSKRVVVDNISPTATVSYNNPIQSANNVSYYGGDINATIVINEANFYKEDVVVTVSKNGSDSRISPSWTDNSVDKHTGTFTLSGDGDYIVKISYKDRSGNKMADYKSNQLTIDTKDPVITVSGIKNQSANNGETIGFTISIADRNIPASGISPVLTATIRDDNGQLKTITIDLGSPLVTTDSQGNTVYTYTVSNLDVDGYYSLNCTAVDYANHSVAQISSEQDNGGNATEQTVNFSVNRDGSVFWVETRHNFAGEKDYIIDDLDGKYINGEVQISIHEVNVDQVDISDSQEQKTAFTLNDGNKVNDVDLVEGTNYTKNTVIGEGGWYETEYVLNNNNFDHDGTYSFNILTYDRAGNSNVNTKDTAGSIKFTVDRTNPVITSNVTTGQIIDADEFTVEFKVNDINPDDQKVQVSVNNILLEEDQLTSLGNNTYSFKMEQGNKQSFKVSTVDLATNNSEKYEIEQVTISTNGFILFYYSHTALFWIIVAAVILIALFIIFLIFKRKKDDDEEEETNSKKK